eukprot:6264480-Alexandrium_andersonii.AAC.1
MSASLVGSEMCIRDSSSECARPPRKGRSADCHPRVSLELPCQRGCGARPCRPVQGADGLGPPVGPVS